MALVRIAVSAADATTNPSADELRQRYELRARAELAAADAQCPGSDTVSWRGALLAEVAVVKGLPGPAEAAGGDALSGADGDAILKALEALGWKPQAVFLTLSRPVSGLDAQRRAARVRAHIEATDPLCVVALDAHAAEDLEAAFGCDPLTPGTTVDVLGRRFVFVSDFEESLGDAARKQRAWRDLQAAKPPGPVY